MSNEILFPIEQIFTDLPFTTQQIATLDQFDLASFQAAPENFNHNNSSTLGIASFSKLISAENKYVYSTACCFTIAEGEWNDGFTIKVEPLPIDTIAIDYFNELINNHFPEKREIGVSTQLSKEQQSVMQKIILDKVRSSLVFNKEKNLGFVYIDSTVYLGRDTRVTSFPVYVGSWMARAQFDNYSLSRHTVDNLRNKSTRMGFSNLTTAEVDLLSTSSTQVRALKDFPIALDELFLSLPVGSVKISIYHGDKEKSHIEYHQRFAYRQSLVNGSDPFSGVAFECVFGKPIDSDIPVPAPEPNIAMSWISVPPNEGV